MLAGIASSEAGRTAGEAAYIAWSAGSETSGKLSCGEVRLKIWRGVTLPPLEDHKNLPLSLPPSLPFSPAPQSSDAEPQLPICGPPPSGN